MLCWEGEFAMVTIGVVEWVGESAMATIGVVDCTVLGE